MNTNPSQPITSITAYNKYCVQPSVIRFISTKSWSISPYFRDCFKSYHILHWTPHHFLEQAQNGYLHRNEGKYEIIYHRTTRGRIISASQDRVVYISFRMPQPEFGLPGIALVSLSPSQYLELCEASSVYRYISSPAVSSISQHLNNSGAYLSCVTLIQSNHLVCLN